MWWELSSPTYRLTVCYNRDMKDSYIRRVLIAIDQLINTICGGDPDETISSRLGKKARAGSIEANIACWLIGKFFFHGNTNHCSEVIEGDEGA